MIMDGNLHPLTEYGNHLVQEGGLDFPGHFRPLPNLTQTPTKSESAIPLQHVDL
jgi:hypothetical protein